MRRALARVTTMQIKNKIKRSFFAYRKSNWRAFCRVAAVTSGGGGGNVKVARIFAGVGARARASTLSNAELLVNRNLKFFFNLHQTVFCCRY